MSCVMQCVSRAKQQRVTADRAHLKLGSSQAHLLVDVLLVESERLAEHTSQLAYLLVERLFVLPCQCRVEQLAGNTLDGGRDGETEGAKGLVLCVEELARVHGIDEAASVLERATLADTVLATSPASVDEPARDVVLGHALGEHLGVAAGVEDDEGSRVAGGEGGDGLEDAVFSSGGLGGVAGKEVVGSLLRGELGDGREDTKGIASEHDDVAGLAVYETGDLSVGDELDGVGAASVFGDADIVVVGNTGDGVVDDVLEDGTEADGVEDFRLLLGRQVDRLGVASTFDVEDALIRPDVLIVTNEESVGVRGEGGLSGTRETEEKGNITSFFADVSRGVEGEGVEPDGLEVVLGEPDKIRANR